MTNRELWLKASGLMGEPELSRRFRNWILGVIRKAEAKQRNITLDEQYLAEATEVIQDLNEKSGYSYGLTDETKDLIYTLLKKGNTVDDFKKVHEVTAKRWRNDPEWEMYLRPCTLYQPKKFGDYKGQWKEPKQPPKQVQAAKIAAQKEEEQKRKRELAERLLKRKWWDFPSWADFVRHCLKFPDAESWERWEMPERIRQMRMSEGMNYSVLRGQSPEWAEAEYRKLKSESS